MSLNGSSFGRLTVVHILKYGDIGSRQIIYKRLFWYEFKNTASSYGDLRDYEELSDVTLVCEDKQHPTPLDQFERELRSRNAASTAILIDMSGNEDGNQTAKKDWTTVEDLMCDLMWMPSDDDQKPQCDMWRGRLKAIGVDN